MTKLTLGQGNLSFVIMKFSQSLEHEIHTHTHTWVTHMGNLITTKKVNCKNGSQQKWSSGPTISLTITQHN
jgi:hypothetical protein